MAETTTEENKDLVLSALRIITGEAPAEDARELFADAYDDHNTAGRTGPEWVAAVAARLRGTFPDLTHEVHQVIAEGDLVALHSTLRGTQDGPFPPFGLEPTGKPVEIATLHVFRIADGRIAEHWAVRDDLGMLRQLGAVPAPPAPAGAR